MEDNEKDELDDENKNDLNEENKTKVHDEEVDDKNVNDKEINESTETDILTSKEVDKRHKRGKNIISEENMQEICEGKKRNDNIGGDDVASVREV